jgi:hypothetical protein
MNKIIILLFVSFLATAGLFAQSPEVKQEQANLKNRVKDKKEDKHEVGNDLAHLRVKSALKGRREVRRHRKTIHNQGERLEKKGVKSPVTKAKRQAKNEKLNKREAKKD